MADNLQDAIDEAFAIQAGQKPLPVASVDPPAKQTASYDPTASNIYTGGVNLANRIYANTITNNHAQENQSAKELGYGFIDPTSGAWEVNRDQNGNVNGAPLDWNTIDATNPYSRAALLKRSYLQGVQGTTSSLASRGQLGSGAMQAMLRNQDFNYKQGQNDLDNQLAHIILQSQQSTSNAAGDKDTSVYQSLLAALQAAPQP